MNKVIIASLRKNAGKTTVMVGLTKALNKKSAI
jgi:cobyrinic acid a,c-diamide synthase